MSELFFFITCSQLTNTDPIVHIACTHSQTHVHTDLYMHVHVHVHACTCPYRYTSMALTDPRNVEVRIYIWAMYLNRSKIIFHSLQLPKYTHTTSIKFTLHMLSCSCTHTHTRVHACTCTCTFPCTCTCMTDPRKVEVCTCALNRNNIFYSLQLPKYTHNLKFTLHMLKTKIYIMCTLTG